MFIRNYIDLIFIEIPKIIRNMTKVKVEIDTDIFIGNVNIVNRLLNSDEISNCIANQVLNGTEQNEKQSCKD